MRTTLLIIVTAMTRKEKPPDSTEQEDEPLLEIAGGFTVDSNASPHIHGQSMTPHPKNWQETRLKNSILKTKYLQYAGTKDQPWNSGKATWTL